MNKRYVHVSLAVVLILVMLTIFSASPTFLLGSSAIGVSASGTQLDRLDQAQLSPATLGEGDTQSVAPIILSAPNGQIDFAPVVDQEPPPDPAQVPLPPPPPVDNEVAVDASGEHSSGQSAVAAKPLIETATRIAEETFEHARLGIFDELTGKLKCSAAGLLSPAGGIVSLGPGACGGDGRSIIALIEIINQAGNSLGAPILAVPSEMAIQNDLSLIHFPSVQVPTSGAVVLPQFLCEPTCNLTDPMIDILSYVYRGPSEWMPIDKSIASVNTKVSKSTLVSKFYGMQYNDRDTRVQPFSDTHINTTFSGGLSVATNINTKARSIAGINLGTQRECVKITNNVCTEFKNTYLSRLITADDAAFIRAFLQKPTATTPSPTRRLIAGTAAITMTDSDARLMDRQFLSYRETTPTQAGRIATLFCRTKGYTSGFLVPLIASTPNALVARCTGNGGQGNTNSVPQGVIISQFSRANAISRWGGHMLGQVSWAQANRLAHDHCTSLRLGDLHPVGGYFTGSVNPVRNDYQITCYTSAYATYYELPQVGAELARVGASSLDDVPWWWANRLATYYCQNLDPNLDVQKPPSGFLTGHQTTSGAFGLVCIDVSGRG